MTTGLIISGFRPVLLLMGRAWFNCNRVFNRFEFIFSNSRRVWDEFKNYYSCLVPIVF